MLRMAYIDLAATRPVGGRSGLGGGPEKGLPRHDRVLRRAGATRIGLVSQRLPAPSYGVSQARRDHQRGCEHLAARVSRALCFVGAFLA